MSWCEHDDVTVVCMNEHDDGLRVPLPNVRIYLFIFPCPSPPPPSFQAPRLHCLAWRKLPSLWPEPSAPLAGTACTVRASLLSHLTQCLGGRHRSRVLPPPPHLKSPLASGTHGPGEAFPKSHRQAVPSPGGHNSTSNAQSLVGVVQGVVRALRPVSLALDLRRAGLSSQRFAPWKDYTTNR